MKMYKISPSILSADFGKLNQEIKEVEPYVDSIHVDVMDAHFVPNLTIGPVVVKGINTKLDLDCHLMISDPVKYAEDFSKYCSRISFHAELFNKTELVNAINEIKKLNVEVGLALNPDKLLSLLIDVLDQIDAVTIMSVYAGFAGQEFLPEVLEKIKELRSKYNYKKDIIIDGGVNKETIKKAADAGANVFVAGSAIFGKKDKEKAINDLRDALK